MAALEEVAAVVAAGTGVLAVVADVVEAAGLELNKLGVAVLVAEETVPAALFRVSPAVPKLSPGADVATGALPNNEAEDWGTAAGVKVGCVPEEVAGVGAKLNEGLAASAAGAVLGAAAPVVGVFPPLNMEGAADLVPLKRLVGAAVVESAFPKRDGVAAVVGFFKGSAGFGPPNRPPAELCTARAGAPKRLAGA